MNPFKNRFLNNNDCFIHIRLTDVAQHNPGYAYYAKALAQMKFDNLYIASDDTNHAIIKQIVEKYPQAIIINYDEIMTLHFAMTTRHIILSHGSFSAVIGYLSFFSEIYYPKYEALKIWYGDIFSIPTWKMVDYTI